MAMSPSKRSGNPIASKEGQTLMAENMSRGGIRGVVIMSFLSPYLPSEPQKLLLIFLPLLLSENNSFLLQSRCVAEKTFLPAGLPPNLFVLPPHSD